MKNMTTIPFAGFYETFFSELAGRGYEYATPDNTLTDSEKSELADLLYTCQSFRKIYEDMAEKYAIDFNDLFKEETGIDLGLVFESLQSPREYNFETDRIFCHITPEKINELYRATDKKILDDAIKGRFTSRSGFISFYPNNLNQWLIETPIKKWDHNQIETIISARLAESGIRGDGFGQGETLSFRMYEKIADRQCNGEFNCFDSKYTRENADKEKIARMDSLLEKSRG